MSREGLTSKNEFDKIASFFFLAGKGSKEKAERILQEQYGLEVIIKSLWPDEKAGFGYTKWNYVILVKKS